MTIRDTGLSLEGRRLVVPFEVKTVHENEEGVFSGKASVFNELDSYQDIILPGAFKNTIKEKGAKGIKMLSQHGSFLGGPDNNPIGVWTDIHETDEALEVTGKLALGTQIGRETHELLKLEALDGLSIGFNTRKSETDEETGIRELSEIDLWEVSVVNFPAMNNARISDVKSFHLLSSEDRNQLQDILRKVSSLCKTERDFEALLRDAGWSKKEAGTIVSRGFKSLLTPRDAGDDELLSLAAHILKAADVLNPQGD